MLLMTPLCTFDFNDKGVLRLKSLNHGVQVDEVVEKTGTEIDIPSEGVPTTPPPTKAQLNLLRRVIDPDRILASL